MNKHDSERLDGMLEALGAACVPDIESADIVVFVTCCVREKADAKLYGQVASMKNIPVRVGSPLGRRIIAIGGCIGQRDGGSLIEALPHVDIVFGTHNIASLPHLLSEVLLDSESHVEVMDAAEGFPTDLPAKREHRWAAWLPIMVGCNNFCTYCIVPYVRGREKSRPFDDIVSEARSLVADGVKEITLLGQNVNSYGHDLSDDIAFADVLDAVSRTGVERLRFATSHPKDLDDAVIARFALLPNLCPSLHLPVQSGSDRILRAMNRKYSVDDYRASIRKMRAACPGVAFSTDIIVGFPGETEEDFQRTYDLVEEIGYSQVFTFIYSRREGTPAARLEDETSHEVIQERFDRLVGLVQGKALEASRSDIGRTVDVLVEGASRRDPSMISGRTPQNRTVHAPVPEGIAIESLQGTTVSVLIDEALTWYLRGSIVDVGLAPGA